MTTPLAKAEHRSRALARLLVLVVLTLTAGVGLVGPASAHTALISSDPSEGAALETGPTLITLTFNEAVQDFQPVVTVLGPDGQKHESGAPVVDGTVVTTPLGPLPTAGDYVIAYRVVSADGHPVQGEVHFRLAAPPPTSSAPASSAPTSSAPTSSGRPATSSAAPTSSAAASTAPGTTSAADSSAGGSTAAPTSSTTAAVAPSSSSSGLSGWAWVAIAVAAALIVAAGVVVVRRTRSQS